MDIDPAVGLDDDDSPSRQTFLNGEGDAWFQRNRELDPISFDRSDQDPLLGLLENLPLPCGPEVSVLKLDAAKASVLLT